MLTDPPARRALLGEGMLADPTWYTPAKIHAAGLSFLIPGADILGQLYGSTHAGLAALHMTHAQALAWGLIPVSDADAPALCHAWQNLIFLRRSTSRAGAPA